MLQYTLAQYRILLRKNNASLLVRFVSMHYSLLLNRRVKTDSITLFLVQVGSKTCPDIYNKMCLFTNPIILGY
jgi:hypothetical protein